MTFESNVIEEVNKLKQEFCELNRLFDLTKMSSESTNVENLAQLFCEYLKKTVDNERNAVFIKNNKFFVPVGNDFIKNNIKYTEKGVIGVLEDEALMDKFDNAALFNTFIKEHHLEEFNFQKIFSIKSNNQIAALVFVGEKNNGNKYSNEESELLKKICETITPSFNKYIIQKKSEADIAELKRAVHNISILYNISQAMNFIDDLKALLKIILDKAISHLDAEKGSLMLYDLDSNDLAVKVVYGLPDKEIEEKINEGLFECTRIKIGEGIAGEVFKSKKPIITNLGHNDPRFVKAINSSVSSLMCIPLIVKGEAIGVINITNKKSQKLFDKNDLEFMQALANQAAIAIDNAQLYEMATKDGLTKLYIYRQFYALLDNELKRANRYGHCLTLVMFDIDNFKNINDTYGHQVGDKVLQELANVLTQTCRNIDLPCRYGGEEFTVILPETPVVNSKIFAERLRQNVENLEIEINNELKVKITISIGVAEFPSHCEDLESLIGKADQALYYSKKNGKNCTSQFDEKGCFKI